MPALEIRLPSGPNDFVQLSKEIPISIGSHPSNDVSIDDASVAPMHCRVSWQKYSYRVNSAAGSEVLLNGKEVAKASLKVGDVISIGKAKITVVDGNRAGHDDQAQADISEFELKPLDSDETIRANREAALHEPLQEEPVATEKAPPENDPPSKNRRKKKQQRVPAPSSESVAELSMGDILASDDALPTTGSSSKDSKRSRADKSSKKDRASEKTKTKTSWNGGRAVRPGERNILQSPLVLTLGGGGLILLLLALTFRFMNNRQEVDGRFQEAAVAKQEGKYAQAIKAFERFLINYPRDSSTNNAQIQLGLTRIQQHVSGSTPAWELGLQSVHEYRQKSKDLPEFSEEANAQELEGYIKKITLGAATSAKNNLDPALLEISAEAGTLLKRIGVDKKETEEHLARVGRVAKEANDAILKRNTFDAAVAKITEALAASQAIAALDERRALLARYPDFASHREIKKLMEQALELEKSTVTREAESVAATTTERESDVASVLSLVRHSRAQSGNKSENSSVVVLSENSCMAVDTINGTPLWSRTIGYDTPFFPLEQTVPDPALLMFDTRNNELLLVSKADGKLIWRNAVSSRASGSPVVNEGQVFLPTTDGELCQFDLETGELTAKLKFAQPISSAPAISESGEYLFVAGHQGVIYILSRRPLECIQVFDSGHAPGVIEAPLMAMGPYLLAIENSQANNCNFRLYDVTEADKGLNEVASYQAVSELLGHVKDTPVLRGNRMFVPSSGERVTAFTVTEEDGQKPLSYVDSSQNESPIGCPIYLAVGPDDQMWMAARDLRKFQLTLDHLEEEVKQRMRVGLCAQPLQVEGNSIFVAGRFPASRAVFFRGVDRQAMSGQWLVVVGAPILATAAPNPSDNSIVCVTAAGDLFLVTAKRISEGGIDTRPLAQLKIQDDPEAAYHAKRLADGRMVVYTTGAKPHLWVVNSGGGIDSELALKEPLQIAPVEFGKSLVLPLPGKLQLLGRSASGGRVQDFALPVTGKKPDAWKALAPLADDQVIALTSTGMLSRLQLREQDNVSFFDEVTLIHLDHAVDVGMVVSGDRLLIADAEPSLSVLNGRSLEVVAKAALPQPAPLAPWMIEDRVYIQCGREQLICFQLGDTLNKLWEVPLPQTSLAGTPLMQDGELLAALQNGEILRINPDTGEVQHRYNVQQAIGDGPYLLGDQLVVISPDGGFIAVQTEKQGAGQ
ncbi:outer membrane biogenesis protein BamB [Symmachiella dynata]|uniref:Outer membrane biogenesis protein BamB n=1 Tax=Symmachiella dynata TaxID=2527995 RepID=A0A517ZYI4_9PLAN|nr:PQQ-binding-like beta-propeller repeat protein [Symmachiella dynata]QDU47547.1 outer membrane biogenesis protein BamB [Symmachiella dynata]